jgi:hypothetical protein
MTSYLGVSRRDVGAGLVAGGSALVGAVLINLWNFLQTFRARGFDSVSIAEYPRGLNGILLLGGIFAPIIAVFVGTVVWRVMMPDEPNPLYGAVAGVVSAFGTLVVFAASIGFVFSLSEFSAGPLVGAIAEFLFLTVLIAVFGGLVTAPVISLLGALVGYSYERYIVEDHG